MKLASLNPPTYRASLFASFFVPFLASALTAASAQAQTRSPLQKPQECFVPFRTSYGTEFVTKLGSQETLELEPIQSEDDYRLGSEWGKKPVTPEVLKSESPGFQRAAFATARVGGATGFYLGTFNGQHVMATNHHVMPRPGTCRNGGARFPFLKVQASCVKYLGTWQSIDLTLFTVSFSSAEDAALAEKYARNFSFDQDVYMGESLLTMGFGIANNPMRTLVANEDSDCKVFSTKGDYHLMADPDEFNPGTYKAWSFANGCDVSHGDSGSAMIDRKTGNVVGIIWTGKIPKNPRVQDSKYLDEIFKSQNGDVWTELSYSVPATKMKEVLGQAVDAADTPQDVARTLRAVLEGGNGLKPVLNESDARSFRRAARR